MRSAKTSGASVSGWSSWISSAVERGEPFALSSSRRSRAASDSSATAATLGVDAGERQVGRAWVGGGVDRLDRGVEAGAVQHAAVASEDQRDDVGEAGLGHRSGDAAGLANGREGRSEEQVDARACERLGLFGVVDGSLVGRQRVSRGVGVARGAQDPGDEDGRARALADLGLHGGCGPVQLGHVAASAGGLRVVA